MVYNYVAFLRESSEIVSLSPLVAAPICDVNDVIVMQTAIIGEADILCTNDDDFFEEPTSEYLTGLGIAVLDDVGLMRRLRHTNLPEHRP
jgi:predicted nucleic acid-binding protein